MVRSWCCVAVSVLYFACMPACCKVMRMQRVTGQKAAAALALGRSWCLVWQLDASCVAVLACTEQMLVFCVCALMPVWHTRCASCLLVEQHAFAIASWRRQPLNCSVRVLYVCSHMLACPCRSSP
jgi:hypothetical protein